MNTRNLKPILFGAAAIVIAASASSCVDAGYAYGTPHTTYRSGYVVNTLPYGYREEYIGGSRYYYHNNVYYRRQGTTYVVVDSPRRPVPRTVRHYDDHRDHDHDRDRDRRGPSRYDDDRRKGPPGPPGPPPHMRKKWD